MTSHVSNSRRQVRVRQLLPLRHGVRPFIKRTRGTDIGFLVEEGTEVEITSAATDSSPVVSELG
jgi:hypothetical protein